MGDGWKDPEFQWGEVGKGCSHCPWSPPVATVEQVKLCPDCIARWFPNWEFERVAQWLWNQRAILAKQKERKKSRGRQLRMFKVA